jgi:hypothetical protein
VTDIFSDEFSAPPSTHGFYVNSSGHHFNLDLRVLYCDPPPTAEEMLSALAGLYRSACEQVEQRLGKVEIL